MANVNRIVRFKNFWQVINSNGHIVAQFTARKQAEEYVQCCGNYPAAYSDIGLESVYRNNAYRDHRYFVRF